MDSVTLEQHLSQSKSCQLPLPPPCSILPHRSLSPARAEHASNALASTKLEHCKKFKLHERIVKLVTSATKKPKATKATKTAERTHTHTHTIRQPKCPVMCTAALGTGLELDLPKLDWSGTGTGLSRHEPVASCLPVFICLRSGNPSRVSMTAPPFHFPLARSLAWLLFG